ncbi:MAG: hypothetical protein Q7R94_02090 [bacterium]|nr:hypothetical protein [bacterium]
MTKTQSILDRDSEIILGELGLGNMPEKDRGEVIEALLDHFNKVIIETAVSSLNDKNLEEFKAALGSSDFEEKIVAIMARVPGLAEKIEEAVNNEFLVLRAAKEIAG